jgi:hypothetical protein
VWASDAHLPWNSTDKHLRGFTKLLEFGTVFVLEMGLFPPPLLLTSAALINLVEATNIQRADCAITTSAYSNVLRNILQAH